MRQGGGMGIEDECFPIDECPFTDVRHAPLGFGFICEKTKFEHIPTIAQAKKYGIKFHDHWKDCQQGEWFRTSDGFVVKMLKRAKSKTGDWFRTAIGTFNIYVKVCDTQPRDSRYSFSGKRRWVILSKKNCSDKEFQFVTILVAQGEPITKKKVYEAFRRTCPGVVGKYPDSWHWRAWTWYYRPHVQREINKHMGTPITKFSEDWFQKEFEKNYNDLNNPKKRKAAEAKLKALSVILSAQLKVQKSGNVVRAPDISDEKKKEIEEETQKKLRNVFDTSPEGGNDRENDLNGTE